MPEADIQLAGFEDLVPARQGVGRDGDPRQPQQGQPGADPRAQKIRKTQCKRQAVEECGQGCGQPEGHWQERFLKDPRVWHIRPMAQRRRTGVEVPVHDRRL